MSAEPAPRLQAFLGSLAQTQNLVVKATWHRLWAEDGVDSKINSQAHDIWPESQGTIAEVMWDACNNCCVVMANERHAAAAKTIAKKWEPK